MKAANGEVASDVFYDPETVQEIRIEIDATQRERLYRSLPERVYVPATFRWRDQIIENVGVRFKGNSSSHPDQPHKRSYLVKFNEYAKGERFLGLRRVALDNAIQFGSVFSEPLITAILRDLGLHASRCNYATLYVNGEYQGVYVNVERVDESFVKARFEAPIGPLYKGEGGPGINLQSVGGDSAVYQRAFEPKTDAAESSYPELAKLIDSVSTVDPAQAAKEFSQMIALDDFIQTMAVMLFSGAFDQLTGWNPHNYYLYRDSKDGRWHYLTSDLDVGFADMAFGQIPVIDGWNAAWPVAGGMPCPLIERIVSSPELIARYRQEADRILERYFRPQILNPKLEALYTRIQGALRTDPFPHRRATVPTDRSFDDVVASIKAFIEKRYRSARAQLDAPGPRPEPVARRSRLDQNRNQQPSPGDHLGAPTELRVVSRSPSEIRLEWKNNADNEFAHVVQRTDGLDDELFWNHIGKPERDLTQAVDRRFDASFTYRYRVFAVFPTEHGPKGTPVSNVVISRPPPRQR